MNTYKITDLGGGLQEHFCYEVTEEKLAMFRMLSGDVNPLHTDETYARKHGFSGKVAYGMLTASLLSTLGGCYLPGEYCIIQGIEAKFNKPVYVGDILTVLGEVIRVDVDLRYCEIKATILNQKKEKVLKGILKVGILDEE